MRYSTGFHTAFHHRYHIVWALKYRFKVLQGDVWLRVREIIRQACAEMGVMIINGALSRDHVHRFVEIPPQGTLIPQDPTGVRAHPQTILGPTFLGQGLLHHVRQHHQ